MQLKAEILKGKYNSRGRGRRIKPKDLFLGRYFQEQHNGKGPILITAFNLKIPDEALQLELE